MFEWGHLIVLARALAQSNDEASLRGAVSRAYYAVYNEAVERGLANGLDPLPKTDERGCRQGFHKACWDAYKNDAYLRQVGMDGERLARARVGADYERANKNWQAEAEDAIEQAVNIRARL